ncbi:SprT-like domain-containing protein [Limnochorda pilosa]|uniref:Metal-dependent hydrolase n=1 Tax=Limnochorda pilosa TaxID=1555112 RepID=A0A0K2SH02_LIMPI|nr:SprT-like domain-containing protein [Limnochorda pilosa]BAS26393.1 metal-dependent hydrolase [Limnochorda pilosa]
MNPGRDRGHSPGHLPAVTVLEDLYERYRRAYFNGQLPPASQVQIEWSGRLTSSAGLCHPKRRLIRLSTHYHLKHPEEVGKTLLHEMIHLLVPGHGPAFARWVDAIRRQGGDVTRHAQDRATPRVIRWIYTCACGQVYPRARRLPRGGRDYRCAHCRGRLSERRV